MTAALQHVEEPNPISALFVGCSPGDPTALEHIFSHSNWVLQQVRTLSGALALLQLVPVPVVICEDRLPDGDWPVLLDRAGRHRRPPRVIVTSRFADDRLWAEVLNLGGYDVLPTPFRAREVFQSVRAAWDSWRFEHQNTVLAVEAPRQPQPSM